MVPFSGKFVQFSGGLNHPCQFHRHNSRNLRGSDGRRDFHLRRKQAGNGPPPGKGDSDVGNPSVFWEFCVIYVSFRGVEHMEFRKWDGFQGESTIFRFHVLLEPSLGMFVLEQSEQTNPQRFRSPPKLPHKKKSRESDPDPKSSGIPALSKCIIILGCFVVIHGETTTVTWKNEIKGWTLLFGAGHHFSASSHGGCHLDRKKLVGMKYSRILGIGFGKKISFLKLTVHLWKRALKRKVLIEPKKNWVSGLEQIVFREGKPHRIHVIYLHVHQNQRPFM